ncbi:MAG: hypothetical protein LCH73_10090 [Proteobacteria bacterium]|nr:hypothetical protein [Pseudomonadota bacterium]
MIKTIDDAASDFIARLPESRRKELRDTVLLSQCAEHWHWFQEVIDCYDLKNPDSPVVRDIRNRFGDVDGMASFMFSRASDSILEADRLLSLIQAQLQQTQG